VFLPDLLICTEELRISIKLQEDVAFVLESIAREVRVSQICNTGPACSQQSLSIEHPVNGVIVYSLNTDTNIIERNIVNQSIVVELSSSEVNFTKLDFLFTGLGIDDQQPKVTIVALVKSRGNSNLEINLQTTITSRDAREEFLN